MYFEELASIRRKLRVLLLLTRHFGGGPLAHEMGNVLVDADVKLSCVYGAAEFKVTAYLLRNEVEKKL